MNRLNIPCWISLSRLLLLPVALLVASLGWSYGFLAAAAVCTLAGATDIFDGYLARRLGCVTPLGTNLDQLSDKLFVLAMMGLLAYIGAIHFWMLAVVILREVVVSLVRLVRFGVQPPTSDAWGKAKMAISMVAIVGLLLRQDLQQGGLLAGVSAYVVLLDLAPWVMLLAVALTVLSGANYLAGYAGLIPRHKALLQGRRAAAIEEEKPFVLS